MSTSMAILRPGQKAQGKKRSYDTYKKIVLTLKPWDNVHHIRIQYQEGHLLLVNS